MRIRKMLRMVELVLAAISLISTLVSKLKVLAFSLVKGIAFALKYSTKLLIFPFSTRVQTLVLLKNDLLRDAAHLT